MNKFIFVMPLMAVSLLASCGGNSNPSSTVIHKLTYFYDNGTTDTFIEKYIDDEKTKEPTWTPTYAGYTFVGWYEEAGVGEQGTEFTFGSALTSEETSIHAHWIVTPVPPTDTYEVTFDFQGGTKGADAVNSVDEITSGTPFYDIIDDFETKQIAVPNDPAHFDFVGWGLTSDTQTKISSTYNVTNNVTVYAIYKPKATATLTFDGGSKNCKLYYIDGGKYTECILGRSILVPAGLDITLFLSSYSDDDVAYLPVFKNNLTITGADYEVLFGSADMITVNIDADAECIVKGKTEKTFPSSGPKLDNYDWETIKYISDSGGADVMFDVGETKEVEINGQSHTVRIIGFDQDYTDPNDRDNTKVGITFDFADLISDAEGYSLATVWNDTADVDTANCNYRTSTLRNNLNGKDDNAKWYRKGETQKSSTYKKSVLNMLPTELSDVITPVSKNVNVYESGQWKETPVSDSLFLLNPKETGLKGEYPPLDFELDVPVYEFYEPDKFSDRIKEQVAKETGAITQPTNIDSSDLLADVEGRSYAGYEHTGGAGSCYYLRSPCAISGGYTSLYNEIWTMSPDGGQTIVGGTDGNQGAYGEAYPIAPAFCI